MQAAAEIHDQARRVGQRLCEELAGVRAGTNVCELNSKVSGIMQSCLNELETTGCVGKANQLPSSELWRVAAATLRQGSLQRHAREKPLGYPGDHELLDRICREDVRGQSIGQAMDVFFQNQAAPQAVRNRSRQTAATILQVISPSPSRLKVTSVGSGPAWDIRWALESLPVDARSRVDVTLVDLDPKALAFCAQQLSPLLPPDNLHLRRANLKRLPRLTSVMHRMADSDIVCCPGYFDYLNDAEAITMLQSLWKCVANGGQLLVFNFSMNNPSRAYMEWIGNWYLNYRTIDSMEGLAASAALTGSDVEVAVEPAGVNLYAHIRRRGNAR